MVWLFSPPVLFGVPLAIALLTYSIELPHTELFWEYKTSAYTPWLYLISFSIVFVICAFYGMSLFLRRHKQIVLKQMSLSSARNLLVGYVVLWSIAFCCLVIILIRYCCFYGGVYEISEGIATGKLILRKREVMKQVVIPGATTLVHLSPAAAVLGTSLLFYAPGRLTRLLTLISGCVFLAVLTVASWILCERLLLLEVLFPILVIWTRKKHGLVCAATLAALLISLVFFWYITTLTRESYFRKREFKGVQARLEYPFMRLMSYLSSNVGNAMYVVENPLPAQFPRYTFPMSQEFLGPGDEVTELFSSGKLNGANNTFGLAGSLFLDMGWLSLSVAAVLGALAGALFSLYLGGSFYASLVYPAICIGLLDAYRTGTLLGSRVLLPFAALTLFYLLSRLFSRIGMKKSGAEGKVLKPSPRQSTISGVLELPR